MTDPTKAVIVGPGAGTRIEGPVGGPLTFKVRGEQTDDRLTVFENVIPPGQGPPLHTHANEDESWYVIEGSFASSSPARLTARRPARLCSCREAPLTAFRTFPTRRRASL
jgi:hypothetical protein